MGIEIKKRKPVSQLELVLIKLYGPDGGAEDILQDMVEEITDLMESGEFSLMSVEEVLFNNGLEPDYVMDLLDMSGLY